MSLGLESLIYEVDNFGNNSNDLIYKSKVAFDFSPTANYNSQIMKFLNYLIELPRYKGIGDAFQADMETFFSRIYSQEEMERMRSFDRKNPSKYKEKYGEGKGEVFKAGEQEEVSKEALRYAEKVKEYSKYLIGQKLSKNIEPFSSKQIQEGDIEVGNAALMRILTKWCEELEDNFRSMGRRNEPFRMQDGSEKFIRREHFAVLRRILDSEKSKIDAYIKELLANNYELQSQLSKEEFLLEMDHFSEFESKVGLFSAFMSKNYHFYLLTYLNALIHGLLSTQQKFTSYILAFDLYKPDPPDDIEEFISACEL